MSSSKATVIGRFAAATESNFMPPTWSFHGPTIAGDIPTIDTTAAAIRRTRATRGEPIGSRAARRHAAITATPISSTMHSPGNNSDSGRSKTFNQPQIRRIVGALSTLAISALNAWISCGHRRMPYACCTLQ
jgi:hypothetical protein